MIKSADIASKLENLGRIFGININQLGQVGSVEELFKQGAILQFQAGKYAEAIAAYNKALKFNPKFWQAWLLRGVALCQLKQFSEAIASFDKVIEIQPNPVATVAALNGQTLAFTELRRYGDALIAHKKVQEIKLTAPKTIPDRNQSNV